MNLRTGRGDQNKFSFKNNQNQDSCKHLRWRALQQ